MSGDEAYDDITPVEETPGYVGNIFDDFISFGDGLQPLEGFDFCSYGTMADELGASRRTIAVDFGAGITRFNFDAYSLAEIVEVIPSVEAVYDCPPNQGPAGGSGYIFILSKGRTTDETIAFARLLRSALDEDFKVIEAAYQQM